MEKTIVTTCEAIRSEEITNQTPIKGWLWLFVWVGMLGGSILTTWRCVKELTLSSPFIEVALDVIYASFFIIIAIKGVRAFRHQESNAVALGKTYIALIYIDAIFSLVVMLIDNDMADLSDVIRNFAWSGIWFTYLSVADDVKTLIPIEKREWRSPEKRILVAFSIYVAILAVFAALSI